MTFLRIVLICILAVTTAPAVSAASCEYLGKRMSCAEAKKRLLRDYRVTVGKNGRVIVVPRSGAGAVAKAQKRYRQQSRAVARHNESMKKMDKGDYAGALAGFNATLKTFPGNAAVLTNRAMAQFRLGNSKAALADLSAALKVAPKNANVRLARAMVLRDTGDYDAALADIETVLKRKPKNSDALLMLATIHFANAEPAKAEDAMLRALKSGKKTPESQEFLARIYLLEGDFPKAKNTALEARRKFPKDEALKKFAKAFESGSAISPGNEAPGITEAAGEKKESETAKPVNTALALTDRALAGFRNGKPLEAMSACEELLVRYPSKPDGFACRAIFFASQNRNREALADLDSAIGRSGSGGLHLFRASLRFAAGDYAGSKTDASIAIAARFRMADAYLIRGLASRELGFTRQAIEDMDQALLLAEPVLAPVISHQLALARGRTGQPAPEEYPQR